MSMLPVSRGEEHGELVRDVVDGVGSRELGLQLPAEVGHVGLDEDGEKAGQVHG